MNRVSAAVAPPSKSTASKYSSELARSRPPSASLSSLNLGLQLHLETRSIPASKCISEFSRSQSPSASPNAIDHSLKVHLQTRTITASKCIVKERRWVSGDKGVTEVEWATRSIYSGHPAVDRQHLIFISSCHTTNIHTLSFLTFGLTRSFRDFVDPRNCADPHGRCSIISSHLLLTLLELKVEGTWGEIFAASHCNANASLYRMNAFRCMVTDAFNASAYV